MTTNKCPTPLECPEILSIIEPCLSTHENVLDADVVEKVVSAEKHLKQAIDAAKKADGRTGLVKTWDTYWKKAFNTFTTVVHRSILR